MKHLRTLIVVMAGINLAACTATKPLTSSVRPHQVVDLQNFETFSYISIIDRGNKASYSDSVSARSNVVFSDILKNFGPKIRLTDDIQVSDLMTKRNVEREIEYLCVTVDQRKNISGLKITPTLDSLLEQREKRFGLITITTGFTRRKGNYGGQIAKGVGIGILTLGMFYPSPVKASSTVYAMIVDSKENNIAFFKKSVLQEKEPLDQIALRRQIRAIFDGYFLVGE